MIRILRILLFQGFLLVAFTPIVSALGPRSRETLQSAARIVEAAETLANIASTSGQNNTQTNSPISNMVETLLAAHNIRELIELSTPLPKPNFELVTEKIENNPSKVILRDRLKEILDTYKRSSKT